MKIRKFRSDNELTHKEVGKIFGVHVGTAVRWANENKTLQGPELAKASKYLAKKGKNMDVEKEEMEDCTNEGKPVETPVEEIPEKGAKGKKKPTAKVVLPPAAPGVLSADTRAAALALLISLANTVPDCWTEDEAKSVKASLKHLILQ